MPVRPPRREGWFGRADLHEFVLSERQRREAAALAEQSAAALHRSREAALARAREAARRGEPPELADDDPVALDEPALIGEELPAGYFLG